MAAPPIKIIIIRHAEKPHGSYSDVQENGTSGNGKSLIVPGWQRAGALNAFFAPHKASPANPAIATPDYIYAASPDGESQRPCETVTPLAAWLKYQQGSPQFNVSFKIGGGEPTMVQSVLGLRGVVLICWEHDNIMPHIMDAIDSAVKITNYASLPPKWPSVFSLVWVLDLSGNAYTWTKTYQNLMHGDVKEAAESD